MSIRVDLHCHSSKSDGEFPPELLAEELVAAGVCFAALTDHDSIAGSARFRAVLEKQGIGVISGVELEVQAPTGVLHLLGYGFDPTDLPFQQSLMSIRSPLWASFRHWARRIGGRTFLSKTWITDSQCTTPDETFIHGRFPIVTAIERIHKIGGKAFLAHPLTGIASPEQLEEIVSWLQTCGLDGLEVFYKPYPQELRRFLLDTANRCGLLASAGSDFHGPHFPGSQGPGIDFPEPHWARFREAVIPNVAAYRIINPA